MKKPDLAMVFGPEGDVPTMDEEMSEAEGMETTGEDSEEMDAALDAAIDDVFATEDPAARREAFKTAIRLCKEAEAEY